MTSFHQYGIQSSYHSRLKRRQLGSGMIRSRYKYVMYCIGGSLASELIYSMSTALHCLHLLGKFGFWVGSQFELLCSLKFTKETLYNSGRNGEIFGIFLNLTGRRFSSLIDTDRENLRTYSGSSCWIIPKFYHYFSNSSIMPGFSLICFMELKLICLLGCLLLNSIIVFLSNTQQVVQFLFWFDYCIFYWPWKSLVLNFFSIYLV